MKQTAVYDPKDLDIIIPCYGSYADYVKAAIVSATPYGTVTIVGDAAAHKVARAHKLRFVASPEPFSIADARNTGIKATSAPYFCFLDADDTYVKGSLPKLVQKLQHHPEWIAVTSQIADSKQSYKWPRSFRARLACAPFGGPTLLFRNSLLTASGCVIRRNQLGRSKLFKNLLDEDWHGSIALRRLGTVGFMRQVSVTYDIRDDSVSNAPRKLKDLRTSYRLLLKTALQVRTSRSLSWRFAEFFAKRFRRRYEATMNVK